MLHSSYHTIHTLLHAIFQCVEKKCGQLLLDSWKNNCSWAKKFVPLKNREDIFCLLWECGWSTESSSSLSSLEKDNSKEYYTTWRNRREWRDTKRTNVLKNTSMTKNKYSGVWRGKDYGSKNTESTSQCPDRLCMNGLWFQGCWPDVHWPSKGEKCASNGLWVAETEERGQLY